MAEPEHLAKLDDGVDEWNRWRKENPNIQVDLQDVRLSDKDLEGIDFSRCNLAGTRLERARLFSANLSRASLGRAWLNRADLAGADLSHASAANAIFNEANLSRANLNLANFGSARLTDAVLRKADLSSTYLSDASLSGADLRNANLKSAELSFAHLQGANLADANAQYAILTKADLSGAKLERADLSLAKFTNASLIGATLAGADLREANFRSSILRGADLSNTRLDSVDFRSANLQNAILDGSSAHKIRLWESQRAGWSIRQIVCGRAYWDKEAVQPTEYAEGEFERLYSDFTTIEFFYQGGVSTFELSTLPAMLRHLAVLHEGVNIRLKSVEETGGGAKISISVGDADAETTEKIKADAMRVFQSQLALRDHQILRLRIEKEYAESFSDKLIQRMLTATAPSNTFNAPVYNAAFASGQSQIAIDQTVNDKAALVSLLETMLAHRADLMLSASQAEHMADQVNAATSELNKKDGDKSVLAKSLGLIQELAKEGLKKAAGTIGEKAISADWHAWFAQLNELSHHLH